MSVDISTPDTVTPDGDPVEPAVPAATPSIKDRSAEAARLAALADGVKAFAASRRAQLESDLLALHLDTGTKSIEAKAPDGTLLATFSVVQPQEGVAVEDEEALIDWVMANHPSEVETITQVKPAFLKELLKKAKPESGEVFHKDTGEPIDGLKVVPAGEAKSITTSWKDKGAALALAFDAGLPAIEA